MACIRIFIKYLYLSVLLLPEPAGILYAHETQVNLNNDQYISGYSYAEAMVLGERIYREGILPDGKIMQAFVQGDIPANGQVFACVNCHRRSGLGTSEGYVVNLPVNSSNLFQSRVSWDTRRRHSRPESTSNPHRQMPSYLLEDTLRQAYTDETLAIVIRSGIDPSGRVLNAVMPRYDLDESAMTLLIHYLKHLSDTYSQGVTDTKIRFATIVTDDVKPSDKESMLAVLKAYIHDRNSQVRNQIKRASNGAFNKREIDSSYRLVDLSVWELKGPENSWYKQLETYAEQDPVFAILGGVSNGSWAPIHAFGETYGIPIIFPVTDKPVISSSDWNTVYFTKGFYQEGEATAKYLRKTRSSFDKIRIIQIFNKGGDGEVAARGFINTWNAFDEKVRKDSELVQVEIDQRLVLENINNNQHKTILLLWGSEEEISSGDIFAKLKRSDVEMIFMSSGLLQGNYSLVSNELMDIVYLTYPYSLPDDKVMHLHILKTWLDIKGIPSMNLAIQSKMYFLGRLLSDVFAGLKSEFYRDYFLEIIEMMSDQTNTMSVYPRLSFGPEQRYASKGCYIVQLANGQQQAIRVKSDWVIH